MSEPHDPDYNRNRVVNRHQDDIAGVIGCFDSLMIKGTPSKMGHDRAMENHRNRTGVPSQEYRQWARRSSRTDACILAREPCQSDQGYSGQQARQTRLKPASGRCSHDCFCFIDETDGLRHVRVPTQAPFMLPICRNGHPWLERQLEKRVLTVNGSIMRACRAEISSRHSRVSAISMSVAWNGT